jgi:hypothetical protein
MKPVPNEDPHIYVDAQTTEHPNLINSYLPDPEITRVVAPAAQQPNRRMTQEDWAWLAERWHRAPPKRREMTADDKRVVAAFAKGETLSHFDGLLLASVWHGTYPPIHLAVDASYSLGCVEVARCECRCHHQEVCDFFLLFFFFARWGCALTSGTGH